MTEKIKLCKKKLHNFSGKRCVECFKLWCIDNKEKILEYKKIWKLKNNLLIKEKDKKYRLNNKEKERLRHKKYNMENREYILNWHKENHKKIYARDGDKIREQKRQDYKKRKELGLLKLRKRPPEYQREWKRKKALSDPMFKIRHNLRTRFRQAFKGNYKTGSSVKDLGCTFEFLKKHLESQFDLEMNWANYGSGKDKWSIDHIIAISTVNLLNRDEFLLVSHYTNLRPLWNKYQMSTYHQEQKHRKVK